MCPLFVTMELIYPFFSSVCPPNSLFLISFFPFRISVSASLFLVLLQEFRQKVMLGTPFMVIWLVGFIADLDIDSWLMKGIMYAGVWVAVQFLSKYVSITQTDTSPIVVHTR